MAVFTPAFEQPGPGGLEKYTVTVNEWSPMFYIQFRDSLDRRRAGQLDLGFTFQIS